LLAALGQRATEQDDPARGGPDQTSDHRQRRRLAGTVRSEETNEFATSEGETQIIDCRAATEPFCEPLDDENRFTRH
jgi:hypothetical protein